MTSTYYQVQSTNALPFAKMNEYVPDYGYLKCNITEDIRKFDIKHTMKYDVFEQCGDDHRFIRLPYFNMDAKNFDDFNNVIIMKQNGSDFSAKLQGRTITIKTPEYCYLPRSQFKRLLKVPAFHFPNKCTTTQIYYTECYRLGGVSAQDRTNAIIMGCMFGIPSGLIAITCIILTIVACIYFACFEDGYTYTYL